MAKTFVAYVIGLPPMGYTQDEMKTLIEQSDFCITGLTGPITVGHIFTIKDYAHPELPKGTSLRVLALACRGKVVSVVEEAAQ